MLVSGRPGEEEGGEQVARAHERLAYERHLHFDHLVRQSATFEQLVFCLNLLLIFYNFFYYKILSEILFTKLSFDKKKSI